MAFTVDDFQDLLRLLEARPDWRAELRRLLLPDEVLELPTVVHQLAEEVRQLANAQLRTETLIARLIEAQDRTEARVSGLEAAMVRLAEAQTRTEERLGRVEERLDRLEEGQVRLESGHARLETALGRTDAKVNALRGSALERRYRDHAGGYFGRLVRRARVLTAEELDDLLDEGLAAGAFDDDGAHDVRLADLVVRGRRPGEEQETFLVVDVSGVVGSHDVERAARRAELLGRIRPALAVVGGEEITSEATALAQAQAVRRLENGRHAPPTPG